MSCSTCKHWHRGTGKEKVDLGTCEEIKASVTAVAIVETTDMAHLLSDNVILGPCVTDSGFLCLHWTARPDAPTRVM